MENYFLGLAIFFILALPEFDIFPLPLPMNVRLVESKNTNKQMNQNQNGKRR